jgi:hypothetical protein
MGLLARRRRVRLTIAGWSTARHCRRQGVASLSFVEVHDGPTDEQFTALMQEVDVAVQLRMPTHGESSAAVTRLIGLGTPVVVTGEGSFAELPAALGQEPPHNRLLCSSHSRWFLRLSSLSRCSGNPDGVIPSAGLRRSPPVLIGVLGFAPAGWRSDSSGA